MILVAFYNSSIKSGNCCPFQSVSAASHRGSAGCLTLPGFGCGAALFGLFSVLIAKDPQGGTVIGLYLCRAKAVIN